MVIAKIYLIIIIKICLLAIFGPFADWNDRFSYAFMYFNYWISDMQLIPPEKIHSSRDSVRKARESLLIGKAMTLEPHGLNRRDNNNNNNNI